ncbi:MAG: Flp pilus assembly complex ATPase component TadA [Holosporales bacterium]|jgi:type II secretory ATPase GspE/PulE/Tfp pilus assembly ATPase PilB-like protein|nr:Flp pilus assembly complex ATPase component TadA [Holosporales bacterium]
MSFEKTDHAHCITWDKFGQCLVEWGFIRQDQVDVILLEQKKEGQLFGDLAVKLGFIDEGWLTKATARYFGLSFVDLDNQPIDDELSCVLTEPFTRKHQIIAFAFENDAVCVALSDPGNVVAKNEIEQLLAGKSVKFFCASTAQIKHALDDQRVRHLKLSHKNASKTVDEILVYASKNNASDIHFETLQDVVRIRVRIDGILSLYKEIHIESWPQIKGRIKVLGNLNITECRMPQSGHANVILSNRSVNLRIATHPSVFGEAVVVRLLDLNNDLLSLPKLGFPGDITAALKQIISRPSGLFIIAGPTGAGKTTTLYALIHELKGKKLNIMTLEDPVEYQMPGLRQLDLREEGILTFAEGIRSVLRQDPDVILIGEIRDENTAAMAVRAALTGRLVMATIHSVDILGAFPRLMDLGVTLHDLSCCLVGVMSQRLLRKLCQDCRRNGQECAACHRLGYAGRVAIPELFIVNDDVKRIMVQPNFEMKAFASVICAYFNSMMSYALSLRDKGVTDQSEIDRVFGAQSYRMLQAQKA